MSLEIPCREIVDIFAMAADGAQPMGFARESEKGDRRLFK
jgi:hypothetical protein